MPAILLIGLVAALMAANAAPQTKDKVHTFAQDAGAKVERVVPSSLTP